MIFVTVGSQKFQFDRLLKAVDVLIENGTITDSVFAQIGYSEYVPKHYSFTEFMDRTEFEAHIDQASIILTHGGTGVIIKSVKKGKKVIAVPRLARYGEHVDDHQLQLIEQFHDANLIVQCTDMEQLGVLLQELPDMEFQSYHSNTATIIASIEEYIKAVNMGV